MGSRLNSLQSLLLKLFLSSVVISFFSSETFAKRQQIRVVGSSAVYPFAATVAERYAYHGDVRTPVVESIGTGGGFKVFCAGTGESYPDIVTASRKITEAEVAMCQSREVKELYEIILGYDGIVLTLSRDVPPFNITRTQLFLALAEEIPSGGKLIKNPYVNWHDIDPTLPHTKIRVFGPSPTSGTRDAFIDLVMNHGCKSVTKGFPRTVRCNRIREDGAYVDVGANENMIIQKVASVIGAIGIVSYSFLDQNIDRVDALAIEGVSPTPTSIQNQTYPISRPLYIYGKKDHERLIPHLHDFILEFTQRSISGSSGYLARRGLIPLPKSKHIKQHYKVKNHIADIFLPLPEDDHGQP